MGDAPVQPNPRVILLGASNLTRGISTVVETARLMLGGPLEVFAALGHGRSYGIDSRIFVRTLPGILQCGLWEALGDLAIERSSDLAIESTNIAPSSSSINQSPNHPITQSNTFALITDIGNDVMYGVPPEEITAWVRECAARLARLNARLIITPPPIASVRTLRPWKYRVVKTAMFPTRKITFDQAIARSHELHDRIVDLAAELDTPAIALPGQWYGFDPIHIRRPIWPHAWQTIFKPWLADDANAPSHAEPSLGRWLHLRSRTPQNWRLLGLARGRQQPSGGLSDGTRISLY